MEWKLYARIWISRRNEIQQQSAWSMHALFIGSQRRDEATIDWENLGRGVEWFHHWIHYPLAEKPTMKLTKCLSHHDGNASCSSPFKKKKKQQQLISFWFNFIGIFRTRGNNLSWLMWMNACETSHLNTKSMNQLKKAKIKIKMR